MEHNHQPETGTAATGATLVAPAGTGSDEVIQWVRLSSITLPLQQAISDAKVFTGRQRPMTEVVLLFAELRTSTGLTGIGFSYSKRAGGPAQYAHAKEVAGDLLGEDPNDISRLYDKLLWSGASVGRSGVAVQAIAALDIALWDLKARRAGLPLAKLLGAQHNAVRTYNTSGGFLHTDIGKVKENATRALESGIGGIKLKVGLPDERTDLLRVRALREHLGEHVPLMVDANQQWDRSRALRIGRRLEEFDLTWIEEPLDAYDAEGHAALTRALDTPVATGEMLSSVAEHRTLIENRACDILQPDAPRVGGITPFLQLATLADVAGLDLAPHFAMEIHLHLAATYRREPWVEHFEWLDPLFNERLEIADGRMLIPDRPGLGISLSDQARAWVTETTEVGRR